MPINCIDPKCGSRSNSIDKEQCKCGTLILLKSRYRVLDRIGKSSHVYEVFIAEDTRENNKIVAIKTLADSDNKKYRKFFYREQQILEDHKYSCLPDLFDYGDEHSVSSRPKILYFVMEFIAGQTLSQWLKTQENKKLSHETAWEWLKNITKTLTELHDQKHLHLDLKPDNIMLREDDSTQKLELVLIDFSIDGSRGTGVYKAPERNNGVKNTPMVDFFSFGQTFVYLTTGEEPETFNPGDNWADRTAFSSSPIINVINWMKEQDPVNRPQTTYQILYAIDVLSKPKSDGNPHTQEDAKNLIENIRGIRGQTLQGSQIQEKDRQIQEKDRQIQEKDRQIQDLDTTITNINQEHNASKNKVGLSKKNIRAGVIISVIALSVLITLKTDLDKAQTALIQSKADLDKAQTALRGHGIVNNPSVKEQDNSYISYGEHYLNFFGGGDQNFKEAETEAIKTFEKGKDDPGKYLEAFSKFKDLYSLNEIVAKAHPEIAVFMNNAKVRYFHSLNKNTSKISPYRIAVVSPVEDETGQHILFGVGLRQQLLINSTANPKDNKHEIPPKIYLEIGIANDNNNKNGLAKIVSKQLAEEPKIHAVIGHYTTEATQAALENYCNNRLAIVSPTASFDGLRNKCKQNQDVFFRTVSSTHTEAEAWGKFSKEGKLIDSDSQLDNIKVFYKFDKKGDDPGFSQNLFENIEKSTGKKFNHKFDLNSDETTLDKLINSFNENTVILLIPNGKNDDDKVFDKAKHILEKIKEKEIAENKNRGKNGNTEKYVMSKYILGSNPLFSVNNVGQDTLNYFQDKLIIAVDWQFKSNSNKTFDDGIEAFTRGGSDRRTAASYEATQAITSLFNGKKLTREQVISGLKELKSLKSHVFKDEREILFDKNGDRANSKDRILVTPTKDSSLFKAYEKK